MMKLYLDDDLIARQMMALLRKASHDFVVPKDAGLSGKSDPEHFTYAIQQGLVLVTRNPEDYEKLHKLVIASGGTHPGLLLVRADDNPKHRMKYPHIVQAIANLQKSGISIISQVVTLNHWR